jgi:hypothetical protein
MYLYGREINKNKNKNNLKILFEYTENLKILTDNRKIVCFFVGRIKPRAWYYQ